MATIKQTFDFFFTSEPANSEILASTFKLTLTGAPDATTDLSPLMSYFQIIRNNGSRSYVTANVVGGIDTLNEILVRPNAEIVVDNVLTTLYGDISEELFRGTFDNLGYTRGAKSLGMTIRASDTFTNSSPKTVNLTSPIFDLKIDSDGRRVFETDNSISLNPGDSVIYESETILIDALTIRVNKTGFYQTLTEGLI